MKNFIILIPPSEGKTPDGKHPPLKKAPPYAQPIINLLKKVSEKDWEKLLGVKGKALEAAVRANKSILTSNTLHSIDRYSGVVYSAIDYPSLSPKAKAFFNAHVRMISAVFGMIKPNDYIPDYKLKIEKLGADKYWKPIIAKMLEGKAVLDLLPKTHKKAVQFSNGQSVEFVIIKNGKKTPAGHNGKFIKGRFIRYICENQITDLENIRNFNEDGYSYTDGHFVKEL